jgi:hypothetical protein
VQDIFINPPAGFKQAEQVSANFFLPLLLNAGFMITSDQLHNVLEREQALRRFL